MLEKNEPSIETNCLTLFGTITDVSPRGRYTGMSSLCLILTNIIPNLRSAKYILCVVSLNNLTIIKLKGENIT
jgi:hypothetical protein